MAVRSTIAVGVLGLAAIAAIWIPSAAGSPAGQTLTVVNARPDNGSVISSPAGISCGTECTASFPTGSTVTLTVTPREEDAFSGFHGDCTGPGPQCTLTMDAAKRVHVNFFGFTLYGVKLRERRGAGLITFRLGARGELELSGEGVEAQALSIPSASIYSLPIVPAGAAARRLKKIGRARVGFRASFTPLGGAPAAARFTAVLIRHKRARRAPVAVTCTRTGARENEPIWTCGSHR